MHGWSRERFCDYLKAQRNRASLSIEDIARTTKIPERSLRQLEAGQFEDLPADVFVRGFLRSYARCVGVDGDEVVRRYALCGLSPAPVASDAARDAAERLAELTAHELTSQREVGPVRVGGAETSIESRIDAIDDVEVAPPPMADTIAESDDEVDSPLSADSDANTDAAPRAEGESAAVAPAGDASGSEPEAVDEPAPTRGTATAAASPASKSTRRTGKRRKRGRGTAAPKSPSGSHRTAAAAPSEPKTALTVLRAGPASIDGRDGDGRDGDGDGRDGDGRDGDGAEDVTIAPSASSGRREPTKQRAFLPPSWADDDASRRGPLTLAVIILVIVATLTMSYLLRRPSYTGDGMTQAPTNAAPPSAAV